MSDHPIQSAPAELQVAKEELKKAVIFRLREMAGVLFMGDPANTKQSAQQVKSLANEKLVVEARKETPSCLALLEVIARLESGSMNLVELLTLNELEEFSAGGRSGRLSFIVDMLRERLNMFASNSGKLSLYVETGSNFTFPSVPEIREMILELIARDIITHKDLDLLPSSPELDKIIQKIKQETACSPVGQTQINVAAAVDSSTAGGTPLQAEKPPSAAPAPAAEASHAPAAAPSAPKMVRSMKKTLKSMGAVSLPPPPQDPPSNAVVIDCPVPDRPAAPQTPTLPWIQKVGRAVGAFLGLTDTEEASGRESHFEAVADSEILPVGGSSTPDKPQTVSEPPSASRRSEFPTSPGMFSPLQIAEAQQKDAIGRLPTLMGKSAVSAIGPTQPLPQVPESAIPSTHPAPLPPESAVASTAPRRRFDAVIGEITDDVRRNIIAEIRKQIEERDRKELEALEEKLAAERKLIEIARIEKRHDGLLKDLECRGRQEAVKDRCLKEGIRNLHLMDDESPEKCEIVLVSPVLYLINRDRVAEPEIKKQEKDGKVETLEDFHALKSHPDPHPFFLFEYKLGRHKSCYGEMKDAKGIVSISKYRQLSDFMLKVFFDPALDSFHFEVIDSNITYKPKDADDFGQIMPSKEKLAEGDCILAGTYLVQIERGHGYTRRKLYEEAYFQIREMLEVIFDTDTTTEEHDHEAYHNIQRILECGLPPEVREKLIEKCQRLYRHDFKKLWEKICNWDDYKLLPDARKFNPLIMSLKMDKSANNFLPPFEINMSHLQAAARLRMEAYVNAALVAAKKPPLLTRLAKKMPSLARLDQKAKDAIVRSEYCRNASIVGAIEIARFIEAKLICLEDLDYINRHPYFERIRRVLNVRALVRRLFTDRSSQLEVIKELLGSGRGKGLLLREVFGADEIIIMNQDVEMHLDTKKVPNLLLCGCPRHTDFLSQYGRKIAYHAWQKRQHKAEPREKKRDLDLITALKEMDVIHTIDLVEKGCKDPVGRTAEIENELIELYEKNALSLRRENLEQDKRKQALLVAEAAREKEKKEFDRQVNQALAAVEVINKAETSQSSNTLGELIDIRPVLFDRNIGDSIEIYWKDLVPPFTWSGLQEKYKKITLQVAQKCIEQAVDTGKDAGFIRSVVNEAVQTGLIDLKQLRVNDSDFRYAELREQYNAIEKEILAGDYDDFDYLDQLEVDADDQLKQYIFSMGFLRTTGSKFQVVIEKLKNNPDDSYCRSLALDVLRKMPEVAQFLSNEELALLQIDNL